MKEWWEFQVDSGNAAGFYAVGRECHSLDLAKLSRRDWLDSLDKRRKRPRSRIKHFQVVETVVEEWNQ